MTKNNEVYKQHYEEVVRALTALRDDEGVPKNVKAKIECIITDLNDGSEVSVKVSKSLHNLDEISEDLNLQSYIRTQIWNVSSMLEKLNQQNS